MMRTTRAMINNPMGASCVMALLRTTKRKFMSAVVTLLALTALLSATACSDDPDEGGIIGSGVVLQGTISETTFAQQRVVDVKSSDGQLTEIAIDSNKRFATTSLAGTAPWVLSVRTNSDLAVYAIAYGDGTRNINRFSDLSLRSWFARESLDLDVQFESPEPFAKLPTMVEFAESASSVFQLIEPVLVSYDVSGEETINASYSSNDQGIDRFLNRNTVLIEQDVVSFVLTDPDTETQSVTRSTLRLDSEFRDNGSSEPTVPGDVKAIGSAKDEIVLVWEPSTDDIAVLEYRIVRDGELIAVTPYPVYIDSELLVVKTYAYEIIAVDVAGNESVASQLALASPLLISDDVAPPAPSVLTKRGASGSAIQFFWVQDEIQDVVSFNLFRGVNEQTPNFLFRGTSTSATDTTVQENVRYCYQVTAIDASGNESNRSEALCITASDTDALNSGTNAPLVEWAVPDLDSLTCDEILANAQVQQGNTVVSAGCYSVPETLTIGAGATLTLNEGVVLKFGQLAKLVVPQYATLTSNGVAENPVVLTGEFTLPGYWGGVEFEGSRSPGNLLRGTVVQYAGGDTLAAINVTARNSRFRIEDTLIRFNQNRAVRFNDFGLVIDEFRGNRITQNDIVGSLSLEILESLVGNSEYIDNFENQFRIGSNSYTDVQITVPDLGIPISWNGVQITQGSLTIEPGVEFSMVSGALVKVDGSFSAIGTVERPIFFEGDFKKPGTWDGLQLSGRGDKTLNHVNIKYAGDARPDTGAIQVICTPENTAKFSIDNVEIADSESWGIYLDGEGCSTDIGENNTYLGTALGTVRFP